MNDLLALAIDAHGGMARWNAVRGIDFTLSLGGGLWKVKGFPEGLRDVRMHVDTTTPASSLSPYPAAGQRGHFEPGRVWIEDAQGRVVADLRDPRATFAGHTLMTPWNRLQELYFSGYAMWNYLTTPFMLALPGITVKELEPHVENGETWRRLHATFPAGFPTHCAEQVFHFDDKGLLQRVDYVTDVVGGVAAHYCFDHATVDGLVFPTLRRVVRRNGSQAALSTPTAVLIQLGDIVVA